MQVGPAETRAAAAERLAEMARAVQKTRESELEAANQAVEAAESEARRLEEQVRQAIWPPSASTPRFGSRA